jgi:hypothetical protein
MTFAKKIATSCFGILSALALVTPAFAQNAGSIVQTSDQTAMQSGYGNVSVQGSAQNANLNQMGYGINGTSILQGNQQAAGQFGNFNSSVQASQQNAHVTQDAGYYPTPYGYPAYPTYPTYPTYPSYDVNGANVTQLNGQLGIQDGVGNVNVQGSDAQAVLGQF